MIGGSLITNSASRREPEAKGNIFNNTFLVNKDKNKNIDPWFSKKPSFSNGRGYRHHHILPPADLPSAPPPTACGEGPKRSIVKLSPIPDQSKRSNNL